ncbi:hypothetical protein [Lysinibacillus sp. FSL P4-0201]|uniref:hypothetical protein n=1 Tax=Lysinibacillus sp. FSL P4-0201 TaxID=2921721 RepID=UPI00315B38AE
MISGFEQSLIKVQDTTINIIKLHLDGKSYNEISSDLKISQEVILEIIEKFETIE